MDVTIANPTFQLLRSAPGLKSLKSEWRRLQTLVGDTKYYQTYEWYACIQESLLVDENELLLVTAVVEPELSGDNLQENSSIGNTG